MMAQTPNSLDGVVSVPKAQPRPSVPQPEKSQRSNSTPETALSPAPLEPEAVLDRVELSPAAQEKQAAAEQRRQEKPEPPDTTARDTTLETIRQFAQETIGRSTKVQFSVDDDTEQIVVSVVNRESGEIVRQIPPDEMRQLRAQLEQLRGVMFDEVS